MNEKIGNVKEKELWTNSDFGHINSHRKTWMAVIRKVENGRVERKFISAAEWDGRTALFNLKEHLGEVIEIEGGSYKYSVRTYIYIDKQGDMYHIAEGTTKEKKVRDAIKEILEKKEEVSEEDKIKQEIKAIEEKYGVKIRYEVVDNV